MNVCLGRAVRQTNRRDISSGNPHISLLILSCHCNAYQQVSQKDMASFRQRLVLSIVRKALTWDSNQEE